MEAPNVSPGRLQGLEVCHMMYCEVLRQFEDSSASMSSCH